MDKLLMIPLLFLLVFAGCVAAGFVCAHLELKHGKRQAYLCAMASVLIITTLLITGIFYLVPSILV
jgi:hypothetical protein